MVAVVTDRADNLECADDMEISPDFFSYFSATASLLDMDKWVEAVCSFYTSIFIFLKHVHFFAMM